MSADARAAVPWMLNGDGDLMPPSLDLLKELRLTDAQWDRWWAVWDQESTARAGGRGGVKLLRATGDPTQPRWVQVVGALIDLDRIAETDRAMALRSEWIKYAGCPGCGSSGAFLRRDKADRYEAGQVRVSCGRRCRTRDVLEALGIETVPEATVLELTTGVLNASTVPETDADKDDDQIGRHVTLTPASAIKPERVRWLWDERLALGTLGLLAGREGLGKSTMAYWLVAQITRGLLPGENYGQPRGVLVCATEDSWEHTIVPRLMAADADLDRVYRVEVVTADLLHFGLSLPRDLPGVESAAAQVDAALLVLDPLMSRLSDELDTHRDAEVRRALEPTVAVAHRAHLAVLGLIHHNKSGSTDPLQLVMGSKAFTSVARSVHTVIPDPDDDNGQMRLFGTPKNNLGRDDLPALAFAIVGHPIPTDDGDAWTGRIEWGPEHTETIADTMRRAGDSDEVRTAATEAAEWLSDYVTSQGGVVPSSDAKASGRAAGHSEHSLRKARRQLHLWVKSEGYPRITYWGDPALADKDPQ